MDYNRLSTSKSKRTFNKKFERYSNYLLKSYNKNNKEFIGKINLFNYSLAIDKKILYREAYYKRFSKDTRTIY